MNIRILEKENDLQAFKTIRIEAVLDAPESFGESSTEVMHRDEKSFIHNLSDHDKGDFVLGYFDHGILLGVAGYYREANEKLSHKGNIWGVYVTPSYRGQGVSTLLLAKAIEIIRVRTGIKQLQLAVATSNAPAVKLYESFGLRSMGPSYNR